MSKRLLNAQEVAERLGLRPSTVYRAAQDGRLPVVRLWRGRRRSLIRFDASAIERLITERAEGLADEPGDER